MQKIKKRLTHWPL